MIGTLLGKEEKADQIIDYYSRQVEDVFSRVKDIEGDLETTVYIEYPNSGADQYGITMSHSGMSLPIDYSGGKNIADDVIARSGQINPEYLINADPDVIIFCMVPGTLTDSGDNIVGFGAHPSQDEVDKVSTYTDRSGGALESGKRRQCLLLLFRLGIQHRKLRYTTVYGEVVLSQ